MASLHSTMVRCMSRCLIPSSSRKASVMIARCSIFSTTSTGGGRSMLSTTTKQQQLRSSPLGSWSLTSWDQEQQQQKQQHQQRRHYTPMTEPEEKQEQERIKGLTTFERDQELRLLNRELARLEKLRGINTGELYTWSGRYKALARDYGMPLVAWYWAVWTSTAVLCYGAISVFDIDTLALLAQFDARTGWDLCSKVNPEMGKIGMAIMVNEVLEPIRLPAVIVTVKPVMDKLYPPKY